MIIHDFNVGICFFYAFKMNDTFRIRLYMTTVPSTQFPHSAVDPTNPITRWSLTNHHWTSLQHLYVSTTGPNQRGPMTNMCPPARPRGPPSRTGHSEMRLEPGSPFITTCPPALLCPGRPAAPPWINRGHVWTADPRPWKWIQQEQQHGTIGVGISKTIRQGSKTGACHLWLEMVVWTIKTVHNVN